MTVRMIKRFAGDARNPLGVDAGRLYNGPLQDYFLSIGMADRKLELSPDYNADFAGVPEPTYARSERLANNLTIPVPVATSGVLFTLTRLLDASSTFTLAAGSDANLSIVNGNQISATAGIAYGNSQVAIVTETPSANVGSRSVTYRVRLSVVAAVAGLVLPVFAAALTGTAAGTSDTNWLVIDDSTGAGAGAKAPTGDGTGANATSTNALRTYAWPQQLAGTWNKGGVQTRADAVLANANLGSGVVNYNGYDPNVSGLVNWTQIVSTIGGLIFQCPSTETGGVTLTPAKAADTAEIYYDRFSTGGTVTVTDSVGALTGSPVNTAGANAYIKASLTRTASVNPVTIQRNGTGGAVNFNGIVWRNATQKYLQVLNGGWIGSTAGDWVTATNPWSPFNALVSFSTQLHLITIKLGLNEQHLGVSDATFQTNLDSLTAKAISTGADVVLIIPHKANSTGSDYYLSAGKIAAINAVAVKYGLQVIDLFNNVTLGTGDYFDAIHLSQQGYAKIAAYIQAQIVSFARL